MSGQLKFTGKTVAANDQLERAVIGTLLIDPKKYREVEGQLLASDFHSTELGVLWNLIGELVSANKAVDEPVLNNLIAQRGLKISPALLVGLQEVSYSAALKDNVERVKEYSVRRMVAETTAAASWAASEDFTLSIKEILDNATGKLISLSEKHIPMESVSLQEALADTLRIIKERANRKGLIGIPTDFRDIDEVMDGLQNGELTVVAARTSVGKTSFAMSMALTMAGRGYKSGFVSLEMPLYKLMVRLMTLQIGLKKRVIEKFSMNSEDFAFFWEEIAKINRLGIFFNNFGSRTFTDLRMLARKWKYEQNISILFIDYLGLIEPTRKYDNKTYEIAEITRGLKLLAIELDIPIVCLAQMNRSIESRMVKRPMLSDLKDSGAIEQDADNVMFLYRDILYNEHADPQEADVILLKHRNGEIADFKLRFIPERTLFTNP